MQSDAIDVISYLQTVPAERKEALKQLHELCRQELNGFEESMRYGMPSYSRNGVVEVSFNSQKQFIALYILRKDVLDRYREQLKGIPMGKGCIRYSKPGKINFYIVRELLRDTHEATGRIC